jgi:hypothetical protein
MFGLSTGSAALNDMIVLDVTSVTNITIKQTYPYNKTSDVDGATNKTTSEEGVETNKELSTGAVIGISVVCAVTVRANFLIAII